MRFFRRFWLELWGLFVDDGSLAIAIVFWAAVTVFLLPGPLPDKWKGPVLFAGLIAILIENVGRSVRRLESRRKKPQR